MELQTLLKNRTIIQELQALTDGLDRLAKALPHSQPATGKVGVLIQQRKSLPGR